MTQTLEQKRAYHAAYGAMYYRANRERLTTRQALHRAAHREEIAARSAEYYKTHREERRAAKAIYAAEYYKTHREKASSRSAAYSAVNPEKRAAYNAKWHAANPDNRRERRAARRAREHGARVERVYRRVVFKRDAGLCGICREAVDPQGWHLDHIVPLSKGGEHSYANTQVTHPVCNLRKSDKMPIKAAA